MRGSGFAVDAILLIPELLTPLFIGKRHLIFVGIILLLEDKLILLFVAMPAVERWMRQDSPLS